MAERRRLLLQGQRRHLVLAAARPCPLELQLCDSEVLVRRGGLHSDPDLPCEEGLGMNQRPHLIPALTSVVLLILALGNHPYGYYAFLRWVVCASALCVA